MTYEPTVWQTGDIVSSQRLNKMEQGIADASNDDILIISATYEVDTTNNTVTYTLPKTWREIADAAFVIVRFPAVYVDDGQVETLDEDEIITPISRIAGDPSQNMYVVGFLVDSRWAAYAESENAYPQTTVEGGL